MKFGMTYGFGALLLKMVREAIEDFEWNENKYWALKESGKDKNRIEEIKLKAQEFLDFLL